LKTPLDAWLYFLRYAETLDSETLTLTLNTEEIRRAVEELKMLTQVNIQKEIYEGRIKMMRDERARENEATEARTGMLKLQAALDEAREKGPMIGRIEAFEKFLFRRSRDLL
jgi:hypothetical protein